MHEIDSINNRIEIYRRAAEKKPRYIAGVLVSISFTVLGVFISDIIVLGGALLLVICFVNLAACSYAGKQLVVLEAERAKSSSPTEEKISQSIGEMSCPLCGKTTPVNSKFCEQCGKRIRDA